MIQYLKEFGLLPLIFLFFLQGRDLFTDKPDRGPTLLTRTMLIAPPAEEVEVTTRSSLTNDNTYIIPEYFTTR